MNEFRAWMLFFFAIAGAYVTIKTYINSTKQRKLENTFRTLDYLRSQISRDQIETFVELFHANNELNGLKFNEFKLKDGRIETIETMFSEGGIGNGHIHNLIELFNLISPSLNSINADLIWYEYGQIMHKLHDWTKYLEDESPNNSSDGNTFYSEFNQYMEDNWIKMLSKPVKYHTYIE